jgi:formylglycine-generating enzyme required for sulfatase activity
MFHRIYREERSVMKTKKHRTFGSRALSLWVFAAVTAIIICFAFTGCKNDEPEAPPPVAVTGVTLDETELSLEGGENTILTATVLPGNATNKNVTWSSDDPAVAIVSEGVVYPVGNGDATITVTTDDGNFTAFCEVSVTVTVEIGINVAVTGVVLEMKETTLFLNGIGSSGFLNPTVLPVNANNKKLRGISFNPKVATVTVNPITGVVTVTSVGIGRTTVTVITEDGEFEAACAVTVSDDFIIPNDMAWIPPGTFMMGSPYDEPESFDDELQHQVTLTEGFFMGIYPVTKEEFKEITGYNSSYAKGSDALYYNEGNFPEEYLSWYAAIVYCNLRSMDEDLSPAYTMYKVSAPYAGNMSRWEDEPDNWSTDPADWGDIPITTYYGRPIRWDNIRVVAGSGGYRLPTEAQWEYACRAGTTTIFNTGNNITPNSGGVTADNVVLGEANYNGVYPYDGNEQGVNLNQTIPVGKYDPNAWGLYDMHGNVAEWCWDWYGSYPRGGAADTDPTGPATVTNKVVRGGSYASRAYQLRSAYRDGLDPVNKETYIGFRVVRPYIAPSEG